LSDKKIDQHYKIKKKNVQMSINSSKNQNNFKTKRCIENLNLNNWYSLQNKKKKTILFKNIGI